MGINIWADGRRNLKEMPDLYDRRLTACRKLEAAQVDLIKAARQIKADREAKIAKFEDQGKPVPEDLKREPIANPDLQQRSVNEQDEEGRPFSAPTLSLADRLVPRSKRPFFRVKPKWAPFGLGFLGIGTKKDTIDWARKEIAECNAGLAKGRHQLDVDTTNDGADQDYYPPLSSAFVHFEKQMAAHMAMQCLAHNRP